MVQSVKMDLEYRSYEGSRDLFGIEIDQDTPYPVIMELAESMGYKVERSFTSNNYIEVLIEGIQNYRNNPNIKIEILINSKGEPLLEQDNLVKIASLLNQDPFDWTQESLVQAFRHIMLFFSSDNKRNRIEEDFLAARKSPEHPLSYDACMLYTYCKRHGVDTRRTMTHSDLGQIAKLLSSSKVKLVEMILVNNKKMNEWEPFESKQKVIDHYSKINFRNLIVKYKPISHQEAVSFAMYRFSINIFLALSPLDEYEHITRNEPNKDLSNYYPRDENIKKLIFRDPSWILLNNSVKWIPPTLGALNFLSQNKVIKEEHVSDLRSVYNLENKNHIYFGIHPYIPLDRIETLVFRTRISSIEDAGSDLLLSVGKLNDKLHLMLLSELTEHFKHEKCFSLPYNKSYYFGEAAISKLKEFCRQNLKSNSKIDKELLNATQDAIILIENYEKDVDRHIKKITKLPESDRACIRKYLEMVRDLAFYMRGWKVGDNQTIPLDSLNTLSGEDDFFLIEQNYTNQMIAIADVYNEWGEELREIVDQIFLMIQKEQDLEKIYVNSTSSEVGRTLVEKLNIIRDNQNDNACIRLSSNYILYTVWYYFKECFNEENFDINRVSFIS